MVPISLCNWLSRMNHSFGDLHLTFWGCACLFFLFFYISFSTFTGVPPSKFLVISTVSMVKTFSSIFKHFRRRTMIKKNQKHWPIVSVIWWILEWIFVLSSSCRFIVQTVADIYEKWSFLNDRSPVVINYSWYMEAYTLNSPTSVFFVFSNLLSAAIRTLEEPTGQ